MALLQNLSPIQQDFYRYLRANKKMTTLTAQGIICRLPKGWLEWPEEQLHEYYFITLDNPNLASKSKSHIHYAIKHLCGYRGLKFDYLPPKVHMRRREDVEPEDVWKLLDVITDTRDLALILTHLYTGLRPGELLGLKKEDLDMDKGMMTIKNTKTYKDRIVPVHKKPLMTIRKYFATRNDADDHVFFSIREKGPVTTVGYRFILQKYCEMAGIKKITPYQIRHTFATQFLENNGDVLILKNIMGHSDIKTTEGYIHENARMIRKGYEKACPEF